MCVWTKNTSYVPTLCLEPAHISEAIPILSISDIEIYPTTTAPVAVAALHVAGNSMLTGHVCMLFPATCSAATATGAVVVGYISMSEMESIGIASEMWAGSRQSVGT